eukprot:6180067-Pleurochrysis_carterae.AAC.1
MNSPSSLPCISVADEQPLYRPSAATHSSRSDRGFGAEREPPKPCAAKRTTAMRSHAAHHYPADTIAPDGVRCTRDLRETCVRCARDVREMTWASRPIERSQRGLSGSKSSPRNLCVRAH